MAPIITIGSFPDATRRCRKHFPQVVLYSATTAGNLQASCRLNTVFTLPF
jgi:hypothetical protein